MNDLIPPQVMGTPVEMTSRDGIEAMQLDRVRWSLQHAYGHVRLYRDRFDAAGMHPDDLRDLADLHRFPFVQKDDLRRSHPLGMLAIPRNRIARFHASSGTAGTPTIVAYSAADMEVWASLMARSLSAAGVRSGDILHNAHGYGIFTGGLGVHQGAERLGVGIMPASSAVVLRHVQLIEDLKPRAITATPSYLLTILEEYERQGLDARASSLGIGILGAEPWTERMRAQIEEGFGIDAVDLYGLSEIIGPGVACEFREAKDGPHIWEDHFYPEIIDPDTGVPLPDGEVGELVITTLTKEGMPMIRYRTGDITRLLPGTMSPMRRLDRISSRTDDVIIIHGVTITPYEVEERVLSMPGLAPMFRIELTRRNSVDQMCLHVEALPGMDGDDQLHVLEQKMVRDIKGMLDVDCVVAVAKPGGMERSQGKAKRVTDQRGALAIPGG
ncbi:MAG: AMP-binding protein [Pseudomonadota bacterium]